MPQARSRHQPRSASAATNRPQASKTTPSQIEAANPKPEPTNRTKALIPRASRPRRSRLGEKKELMAKLPSRRCAIPHSVAARTFLYRVWLLRCRPETSTAQLAGGSHNGGPPSTPRHPDACPASARLAGPGCNDRQPLWLLLIPFSHYLHTQCTHLRNRATTEIQSWDSERVTIFITSIYRLQYTPLMISKTILLQNIDSCTHLRHI